MNCLGSGCDKEPISRGMCGTHWRRWRRHGDPEYVRLCRACSVDGCERAHDYDGLCSLHQQRRRRTGRLALLTPREKFWARVDRGNGEGCWLWTACPDRHYGHFHFLYSEFGTRLAHRLSYLLLVGPIPDGYDIDHLCRVTRCVRPDHLEAVTPQENRRRQALALSAKPTTSRKEQAA